MLDGQAAHLLDPVSCVFRYRVGDPQSQNFHLDLPNWKRIQSFWFAESPHVAEAQVVLGISTTSNLDVANVQFQPYGNYGKSQDTTATTLNQTNMP